MYRYLENGSTLVLNEKACTGCGSCVEVCPHQVFALVPAETGRSRAEIVNRDGCMECGACSGNCPVEAIAVRRGVGCAAAVWNGLRRGGEASCDCTKGGC